MLDKLKDFARRVWRSKPLKPIRVFTERCVDFVNAIREGRWRSEPAVLIGLAATLVTELGPIVEDASVPWYERIVRVAPLALGIITSTLVTPVGPNVDPEVLAASPPSPEAIEAAKRISDANPPSLG